jgi:histone-lysine N-methyltransferase SETD3
VRARIDITEGQEVLRIPRTHLITPELARQSDIGRRLAAQAGPDHDDFDDFLYLSSWLLQEKHRGEDSFWKPFVDTQPQAYPHLPLFFGEHERALLQGSQLPPRVELQAQSLQREYAELCLKVPGYERFTFDEFVWARLSCDSRLFALKTGGLQGMCMAPLADMFNHREPPDVLWSSSPDGQCFLMTARRAVVAGAQVHTSYGGKSNDLLLRHFGFMTDDLTHDEVHFSLDLKALADVKQRLFSPAPGEDCPPVRLSRVYEHPANRSLFSLLRIACSTPEEFQEAAQRPGLQGLEPLSVTSEEEVLRTVGAACEERLAAFPQSLAEDERLLREERLSPNARNCVRFRRAEKQLLQDYLDMTRTGRALLRTPREEVERLAGRAGRPWGWFDAYIRQDILGLLRRGSCSRLSFPP